MIEIHGPSLQGRLPPYVYKAFERSEYVRSFLDEGRVRLGLLQSYREIEGASRRDEAEGGTEYRIKGPVRQLTVDLGTRRVVGESLVPGEIQYGSEYGLARRKVGWLKCGTTSAGGGSTSQSSSMAIRT